MSSGTPGTINKAGLGVLFLLLSGILAGQNPAVQGAADPLSEQAQAEVKRFVDEKLAAWQHRLNLDEWAISVTSSRKTELKPKTLGGIRWDKKKKTAAIAVLDPSEYRIPFDEMLADLEFTIVHELVHLELSSLPRSEASRTNEEYAVNRLAEALLSLQRQK